MTLKGVMRSCTYIANICRQESFQGGQMSLPKWVIYLITENIPKYTSAASFAVFYSHCLLNGYEKDIDKQTWIKSIIVFNVLINIWQLLADHKQNQLQNVNLGQNPMYITCWGLTGWGAVLQKVTWRSKWATTGFRAAEGRLRDGDGKGWGV